MSNEDKYYRKEWMSEDQWECAKFMAWFYRGWHHSPQKIHEWGNGICVNTDPHGLATFDFANLTRLVFMAHDECIRVEFRGSGPGMVKIIFHKRHKREGSMYEYHPTLEEAISKHRKIFK